MAGKAVTMQDLKQWCLTLGLGALGGIIAYFIGFPAPFLTGPAIAVTIGGLSGLTLDIPNIIRNICFVSIGLSMGAGVTPEVIDTMNTWPWAFAILALTVIAIFWGGRTLLHKGWNYDPMTATLAASPGHLSFILGLTSQTKADLPTISIVQTIRVLALTVLVPFAVSFMDLGSGEGRSPLPILPLITLGGLAALSIATGWAFQKIKLPAAFLLGGMFISTLTHVTGWVEGQIPQWLAILSFIIMGCIIGSRFSGVSLSMLRKAAGAGIAATLLATMIAIITGSIASYFLDLPLPQLLISFAPGGVEAMVAMSVIMDVDVTFVAAQHVFRLFLLTLLAPLALSLTNRAITKSQ